MNAITDTAVSTTAICTVAVKDLMALSHLAGVKDIRNYLNGVYIEFDGDNLAMVATDGSVIGVIRSGLTGHVGKGQLLIAHQVIKHIGKTAEVIQLQSLELPGHWLLKSGTMQFEFESIVNSSNYTFPNWRQLFKGLISDPPNNEPAYYSINLLNKVEKCARSLSYKPSRTQNNFELTQNGNSSAPVRVPGCERFAGLLMPVRSEPILDTFPSSIID